MSTKKDKTQPTTHPKAKKATKPTQAKPKKPTTRATTRASTQKAKEEIKEKNTDTEQTGEVQRKRRKYVAHPDSDEERIESEDNNQFKVVSHLPKFAIAKLCEKIRNVDLNDLKTLDFNKISREE